MPSNANFLARLEDRMRAAGDAAAFETGDGKVLTYAQLLDEIGRAAAALESLGVEAGDRVMVQVDKSLANVFLYLGTLKLGAVYNPLNSAYMPAELEYFIADAEPKVIVASASRIAEIEPAAAKANVRSLLTMGSDGNGSFSELAAGQAPLRVTAARAGDDLAALIYTSGTTGRSKGAMITHRNIASNAETLHAYWKFQPGDVLLHALPIFHVHGLFVALHTALLNGSRILWMPKFDLEELMRLLPQATILMGVPTFYTRLLGSKAFGKAPCSRLRLAISGSAPLLAETHEEFTKRTGHRILERYGMTEAGMITSNPYDGERVAGTVGFALPEIDVRIADKDGREVKTGEVGVLEVKGPNVFKGYWRNPQKTKEEFRADGYFVSGDLATMDAEQRITIVGRAKDLIITGGFNVYPKEIEEELNALPGVDESAVVGVPHPDFGEGIVAVLTPQPGKTPPSEADVIAALGKRLAKFKLPKRVFVADELPRNAMGKVQKTDLSAKYRNLFKS
ncbi:MAG TPA: malonyl-CoA synthase [Hyphomicrobiaceae bacterium]|nr:malonyl-CoA synthase [Hyphomicrobiaceae bacterium]